MDLGPERPDTLILVIEVNRTDATGRLAVLRDMFVSAPAPTLVPLARVGQEVIVAWQLAIAADPAAFGAGLHELLISATIIRSKLRALVAFAK